MKAIELTNVQKTIDDPFAIGPIDVSIDSGCVVGLVGSNGAGKSSLFRMMMGLVKAEEGNIRVAGYDIEEESVHLKRETAYVSQTVIGPGGFSLNELAKLHGIVYTDWSESRFHKYIETFRLPINKRLDTLSAGIQKKAMLALQLSRGSRVLLLDEPYATLDLAGQQTLDEELVAYMERGDEQTVVFASHSGDEIKRMADYIWLIHEGQHVGFYEKDALQRSWGRVWIDELSADSDSIPGVVRREPSGNVLITERIDDTLAVIQQHVVHTQPMDLRDILSELLKRAEKGEQQQ